MPNLELEPKVEYRSIVRGILRQQVDRGDPDQSVESGNRKTAHIEEMASLKFAWTACQHVKSNAIVFAQGEATVGIGGGQPNRVIVCGLPPSVPGISQRERLWHQMHTSRSLIQ